MNLSSAMSEELTQLRAALAEIHDELVDAEAELADRLAEINAFELEFERKVGHLADNLERLDAEIQGYNDRIQMHRNRKIFGNAHLPVAEQYRRTWQKPSPTAPTPPPEPPSPAGEAEIKRLYRQLARRFHPDLANDEADRVHRTHKMAAINDAYAARSLVELVVLGREVESIIDIGQVSSAQTEAQVVGALKAELGRCRRRLREIERELRHLIHRPSVQLSLEVKTAHRRGRDLLAELAAELAHKITRKTVERDMLKTQFDQLGPDQGFIPLRRS